jgi:hypothetical protein
MILKYDEYFGCVHTWSLGPPNFKAYVIFIGKFGRERSKIVITEMGKIWDRISHYKF